MNTNLDLGITGLVLIGAWYALSIVRQTFLGTRTPTASSMRQMDHQRIKDIHRMSTDTDNHKKAGDYSCVWRGRDEVRDSLELQRDVLDMPTQLLTALKDLTTELRLARNGGSRV